MALWTSSIKWDMTALPDEFTPTHHSTNLQRWHIWQHQKKVWKQPTIIHSWLQKNAAPLRWDTVAVTGIKDVYGYLSLYFSFLFDILDLIKWVIFL